MSLTYPRRLSRAASQSTAPVVLAACLWHPIPWVARAAAANHRTPRWAVNLARKQKRLLDAFLASPRASNEQLRQHASDPEAPPELLDIIANHPNAEANSLRLVTAHPKAGTAIHLHALRHPACPPDLTLKLATEAEPVGDLKFPHTLQRAAVAEENAPPGLLEWLAHNCSDRVVLEAVAQHPNTNEPDAVAAALRASGIP